MGLSVVNTAVIRRLTYNSSFAHGKGDGLLSCCINTVRCRRYLDQKSSCPGHGECCPVEGPHSGSSRLKGPGSSSCIRIQRKITGNINIRTIKPQTSVGSCDIDRSSRPVRDHTGSGHCIIICIILPIGILFYRPAEGVHSTRCGIVGHPTVKRPFHIHGQLLLRNVCRSLKCHVCLCTKLAVSAVRQHICCRIIVGKYHSARTGGCSNPGNLSLVCPIVLRHRQSAVFIRYNITQILSIDRDRYLIGKYICLITISRSAQCDVCTILCIPPGNTGGRCHRSAADRCSIGKRRL